MLDLQVEYDLPINIIVGERLTHVRVLTLEYHNKEDILLKEWLVKRASRMELRELGAYEDDDSDDNSL